MKLRIGIENVAVVIALLAIGGCLLRYRGDAALIRQASIDAMTPARPDPFGDRCLPSELGDNIRVVECPWFDLEAGKFVDVDWEKLSEEREARRARARGARPHEMRAPGGLPQTDAPSTSPTNPSGTETRARPTSPPMR